jgi:hypothetical protein
VFVAAGERLNFLTPSAVIHSRSSLLLRDTIFARRAVPVHTTSPGLRRAIAIGFRLARQNIILDSPFFSHTVITRNLFTRWTFIGPGPSLLLRDIFLTTVVGRRSLWDRYIVICRCFFPLLWDAFFTADRLFRRRRVLPVCNASPWPGGVVIDGLL